MTQGKVKWFNNAKGYGFVRADDADEDFFVHHSYILMSGYRSLRAGERVEFEIETRSQGRHAIHLRPLERLDTPLA